MLVSVRNFCRFSEGELTTRRGIVRMAIERRIVFVIERIRWWP